MSGYRPIYKRIWKDPDFQDLNATDKLLFIYLCTNEATTESGIYPLTPKTASYETQIDIATVIQRFSNGFYKNIIYDQEYKLIFVRKLRKYNTGGNPALIYKSINNEHDIYPDTHLWEEFIKEYPEYKGLINGSKSVVQPTVNLNLNNIDNTIIDGGNEFKKEPPEFITLRKELFTGLKDRRNYNLTPGQRAGEAKTMGWLFRQGYKPDDILNAYDLMCKDKFWSDKPLTIMTVAKQIGAVLKGNRPKRSKHGDGW